MTEKNQPEAAAGPAGTHADGTATAASGSEPQPVVPTQQRRDTGAPEEANGVGPRPGPAASDPAPSSAASPGAVCASSAGADGTPDGPPASAVPAPAVDDHAGRTPAVGDHAGRTPAVGDHAGRTPAVGRNGRVIARSRTGAGLVPSPSDRPTSAAPAPDTATGSSEGDVPSDGDVPSPGSGKRWSRRAKAVLVGGCGLALAAVATPLLLSAVNGADTSGADDSPAPAPGPPSDSTRSEAASVLRAMALTTAAIGYAPGITDSGSPGRGTLAKARQDSLRFALAAWAAGGSPARDDGLYGTLLRSSGTSDGVVTTHVGLAPRGEVLAADVAPEGHKLAVLTRRREEGGARMRVLAFGKDAAAPKWSTVGPAVDPASAFAISDCGGMLAFAEPDGHREVWNMMGAEPEKVFESNGNGVDRSAGERQFLDFNNDTHRLLYAYGPPDALRGEVIAVHEAVPFVETGVTFPRGRQSGEVRLNGVKATAVTVPAGSDGTFLSRYGERVSAGSANGILTDASHRYIVERHGSAQDVYAVRVHLPLLNRTYQAVLPAGARAAAISGGKQTMVVPVREDGKTLRMLVLTDGALSVVDGSRVNDPDRATLPKGDTLVSRACETSPQPLTARELSALPAAARASAAAAWPCR
ncbi:hypothetical protein [Streptomyces sp. NPDC050504]|uniref:hypothetical protein n=1 Tax=Streptomyces sp. NPDC050504 TaxID=3365618 RepID=UPI0037A49B89